MVADAVLHCTALTLTPILFVVAYDNTNSDDDDDDYDDDDDDADKDKAIKVMFSRRREFQTRIPPKTSYACRHTHTRQEEEDDDNDDDDEEAEGTDDEAQSR
ncbi:hypothetical protein TWF703_003843 [Orbilia oligospora]|uniref:Secreted protein n=1 Tax=Orbilia oligospora TaxID=2813651 RepID=A0A7C8JIJ3_ORBOL|nr:hypothetical protein TWF703_003843 [Orbilia oligospora]